MKLTPRDPVRALALVVALGVFLPRLSLAQEGYWHGRISTPDRSWEAGLDIDMTGPAPRVRVDLPDRWRLDVPASDVRMEGDSISLALPTELGLLEARIFADSIAGRVVLEDGVTARLHLLPGARPVVRETDISFTNPMDGTRIAATVMSPGGPGPFPAVVVLHGGGDSSREQAPGYRFWGTWLVRNGIVGLVYDKRGNGESGGAWKEVGFDARAVDVATAVENLRRIPSVDARRVGLLGVSQGSWVAGLVAAADRELAFVVNVSGPAVSVAAADGYAMRRGLLERGAPPEAVDRLTDFWWMEVDAILHGDSGRVHRLEREVQKSAEAPWFEDFSYSVGPVDGWWWNWYKRVADYDPVPVLRTTDVRMLWVYGDVDTESEVSRNIAVLEQLRDGGRDYEIAVFPRAGHGLMVPADRLGRSEGTLTVAPGFFRTVFDYIRR